MNEGITFKFRDQQEDGSLPEEDFVYEHGIQDYVAELAGEGALTAPVFWQAEKRGRDRADKPEYKVKLSAACCFSNKCRSSSTTTTPPGWSTAARRKRQQKALLSPQ